VGGAERVEAQLPAAVALDQLAAPHTDCSAGGDEGGVLPIPLQGSAGVSRLPQRFRLSAHIGLDPQRSPVFRGAPVRVGVLRITHSKNRHEHWDCGAALEFTGNPAVLATHPVGPVVLQAHRLFEILVACVV
jgi:hypothetical protein